MNINKRLLMLACSTALCATVPELHAQTPNATSSLEEVRLGHDPHQPTVIPHDGKATELVLQE